MRQALLFLPALAGCAHVEAEIADLRVDGAQWYADGQFTERVAYVRDGRLKFDRPGLTAQHIVDASGGYAVPPFCEGHNHNFGGSADNVEETSAAYLNDGVFYALMPGSFAAYRSQIENRLGTPQSVDVVFANNGLTGPGGHPRGLRESLKARFGLYPEFSVEALADTGYFEAANAAEVRAKMQRIKAERPDLVKVMLYFSEEFAERADNPDYYGRRGLDPALLPLVVELAHADGLRVIVHVESEADLVTAVTAGSDIIAHLPSYDAPVHLSDETIALVASKPGLALVTTFSLAKREEARAPETYPAIVAAQKDNLTRLVAAGANLVVGSDNTRDTSRGEVEYLRTLGVLSEAKLLAMWTSDCTAMLFPGRKLGRLADGYEASFLVLRGNPLEDFSAVDDIAIRVKDGELLPAR